MRNKGTDCKVSLCLLINKIKMFSWLVETFRKVNIYMISMDNLANKARQNASKMLMQL